MSSNIVGEPFKDYVAKQVNERQKIHGKLERTTKELYYLNSRTSWIKLGSGTFISQSRLDLIPGLPQGYPEGKFLPVSYILFNGTTAMDYSTGTITSDNSSTQVDPTVNFPEFNNEGIRILSEGDLSQSPDTITKESETFGPYRYASGIMGNTQTGLPVYGYGGNTDFGLVPMPGIESATVKSMEMGSIKKANIKLKVFNKAQFDIIETLYMRLGYTMLLEWGDSHYLDPDSSGDIIKPLGNTLLNKEFYSGGNDGKSHLEFLKIIENERKKYKGGYDALLGKVVNFKWTFNPDNSYSIDLDLISLGDVIESLKMDLVSYETQVANSNNNSKKEEDEDLDVIDANRNKHKLGTILYNIRLANAINNESLEGEIIKLNDIEVGYVQKQVPIEIALNDGLNGFFTEYRSKKGNKFTPTGELAPNGFWGDLFGVEDNYTKLKNEFYGKMGAINFDSPKDFTKEEDLNYVFLTGLNNQEYSNFIRLGHLFDLIQAYLIPYDKKSLDPLVVLDTNINRNLMFYIPNMVSIDPKVCIIRNDEFYTTPNVTQKVYEGLAPFKWDPPPENSLSGNNNYGKVMNIYINFVEVLALLDNVDKEGRISLMDFLKNVCRKLNRALGGVNKLTPRIFEEEDTIRLVDETPLPDKESLHILFKGKAPEKYIFDLYGYDTKTNDSGSFSTSNFVHKAGITTTVTPEYATMITVGSTANGFVVGEDATFFSKWNKGIVDRFKEELVVGNEMFNKGPDRELERYRKIWNDYYQLLQTGQIHGWFPSQEKEFEMDFSKMGSLEAKGSVAIAEAGNITGIPSSQPLDDDIVSANYNKVPAFYKLLKYYSSQDSKSKKEYSSMDIGFLPFHLQLDIDGMSGTKIYNKIKINSKFLPTNYSDFQGDRLEFVLTNVDHELNKNQWVTKLNSIATIGDKYLLETIDYRQTLLDRFFGGLGKDFNNFYSYNQKLFGKDTPVYDYQRPSSAENGNKITQGKISWYDNTTLTRNKPQVSDNLKIIIKTMETAGITNPIAQLGILSTMGKESKFIPIQEKMFGKNQIDGKKGALHYFTGRFNNYYGKGNWDRQTVVDLLADRSPKGKENWFNTIYGWNQTSSDSKLWHKPGDGKGFKYRGRGLNQITWQYNYVNQNNNTKKLFGSNYKGNIIDFPDQLNNDIEVSAMVAVTFFINGYKKFSKKYKQFPQDINDFEDLDQSILAFCSVNGGNKLKSYDSNSVIGANGYRGYFFIDGYLDIPESNRPSEAVVLNPIVQDNQEVKTVEIKDDPSSQQPPPPPPPTGNKITFNLSQPLDQVDWDLAHGVSSKRIPDDFIKECEEVSKKEKIKITNFSMNITYNPSTNNIDSKFEATWVSPQGNEKPDTIFTSRGSIGNDYQNRFKKQVILPNEDGKNLQERLIDTYPNTNFKDWLFQNQEITYPGGSIFYSQIFIVGSAK
jgi:predicted chitinase